MEDKDWRQKAVFEKELRRLREIVEVYYDLLVNTQQDKPEYREALRIDLDHRYDELQPYLMLFSGHPALTDHMTSDSFPAYDIAFSSGVIERVKPSLEAVLNDLSIVLVRIQDMSDRQYKGIIDPSDIKVDTMWNKALHNWQRFLNPLWLLWRMGSFLWRHKIIAAFFVLLFALILLMYLK